MASQNAPLYQPILTVKPASRNQRTYPTPQGIVIPWIMPHHSVFFEVKMCLLTLWHVCCMSGHVLQSIDTAFIVKMCWWTGVFCDTLMCVLHQCCACSMCVCVLCCMHYSVDMCHFLCICPMCSECVHIFWAYTLHLCVLFRNKYPDG